jgi:hypothetical protein
MSFPHSVPELLPSLVPSLFSSFSTFARKNNILGNKLFKKWNYEEESIKNDGDNKSVEINFNLEEIEKTNVTEEKVDSFLSEVAEGIDSVFFIFNLLFYILYCRLYPL